MKKILFITNIMPFPGNSGGTIKTRKLLDGLIEKGYGIYLCFLDVNIEDKYSVWKKVYENALLGFERVYNGNNIRSAKNYISSLFYGIPLNVYRNRSNEMQNIIDSILEKNKIDVIIADHVEMVQYVPTKYLDKAIFHDHNAEYKIWERYGLQQRNKLKKFLIEFEAKRLEKYEKKACENFKMVAAAPEDLNFISGGRLSEKYRLTYHMGNDNLLDLPTLTKPEEFNILYFGTLTWEANIQGIKWFVKNVMPIIKRSYPNVKMDIIGKADNNVFSDIQDSNVRFLGFVDSLEEYMSNATVFVCPLFFGSGMKLKIIESMYRGLPFVTTKIGAESIIIYDEEKEYEYPYAGIVTDDMNQFADSVIELHENKSKWESISKTARKIASKEYRWIDEIDRFASIVESI